MRLSKWLNVMAKWNPKGHKASRSIIFPRSDNHHIHQTSLLSTFISSKIKYHLKETRCHDAEDIHKNSTRFPITKKRVLVMLSSVKTMLDKICGFSRGLLRRRLNIKFMCCSFVFITQVPILSDHTS